MQQQAFRLAALALLLGVLAAPLPAAGEEEPGAAAIGRLTWLAGCWHQQLGERLTEECWLPPRDGVMLGLNRVSGGGGRPFFEFLRIADEGGGVAYHADPQGQPPASFALVEIGEHRVTFENPEHDFPQRISYWLDESGALRARIEGVVGGEPRGGDWIYRRAGSGAGWAAGD